MFPNSRVTGMNGVVYHSMKQRHVTDCEIGNDGFRDVVRILGTVRALLLETQSV